MSLNPRKKFCHVCDSIKHLNSAFVSNNARSKSLEKEKTLKKVTSNEKIQENKNNNSKPSSFLKTNSQANRIGRKALNERDFIEENIKVVRDLSKSPGSSKIFESFYSSSQKKLNNSRNNVLAGENINRGKEGCFVSNKIGFSTTKHENEKKYWEAKQNRNIETGKEKRTKFGINPFQVDLRARSSSNNLSNTKNKLITYRKLDENIISNNSSVNTDSIKNPSIVSCNINKIPNANLQIKNRRKYLKLKNKQIEIAEKNMTHVSRKSSASNEKKVTFSENLKETIIIPTYKERNSSDECLSSPIQSDNDEWISLSFSKLNESTSDIVEELKQKLFSYNNVSARPSRKSSANDESFLSSFKARSNPENSFSFEADNKPFFTKDRFQKMIGCRYDKSSNEGSVLIDTSKSSNKSLNVELNSRHSRQYKNRQISNFEKPNININ